MCIIEKNNRIIVKVLLQPRSSRDEVVAQQGDCLKIRITAPPVENRANQRVCELIAKLVGVAKREVEIIGGHTSRVKQVQITGGTLEEVKKKLLPNS